MKAWLVNSNSKNSSHCFEYMIRHNKVAAYYAGWNTQIDLIQKGDIVLLHHNGYGVIAVGCVVQEFRPHDYQHDMGLMDEHWADVNWLWKATFIEQNGKLDPINAIHSTDLGVKVFLQVVINITAQLDYKQLWEEIAKRQVYL